MKKVRLSWHLLAKLAELDRLEGEISGLYQFTSAEILNGLQMTAVVESASASKVDDLIVDYDKAREIIDSGNSDLEIVAYAIVLKELYENYGNLAFTENNIEKVYQRLSALENRTSDPEFSPEFSGLIAWCKESINQHSFHPVPVIAAFIYEFICMHPVDETSEKFSKILMMWLLLRSDYNAIKWASLDLEIEKNREWGQAILAACQSSRPDDDITEWVEFVIDQMINVSRKLIPKMAHGVADPSMIPRHNRIVEYLSKSGPLKVGSLSQHLGINVNTLKKDLQALILTHHVSKSGVGKGTYYSAG